MKLSTKGRYAVRFMLDLAMRHDKGPSSLKDIAGRQDISEKYLGHLVPPLKAAGLIVSARGPRGGYMLSREPRQIDLLQVVTAAEGTMCLVDCAEKHGRCDRAADCVAREVWSEVTARINEALSSVTLEDMAGRQRNKLDTFSYTI